MLVFVGYFVVVFEGDWVQDQFEQYQEYCQVEVGEVDCVQWWLCGEDCIVIEYQLYLVVFLYWVDGVDYQLVFVVGFGYEWEQGVNVEVEIVYYCLGDQQNVEQQLLDYVECGVIEFNEFYLGFFVLCLIVGWCSGIGGKGCGCSLQ